MLDKEIIKKIKQGDRESFNSLCSGFYARLISYARLFLSEEWAEDVIQDVFFSIWRNREKLDENLSINSYCFRAVHNMSLNYLKSKKHSDDFREWNYDRIAKIALSSIDVERDSVLGKLYDGDLRKRINEAIDSLPQRQKEIFNLSYVEEMTSKEISKRLGISSRTVESHLYQAMKHLRNYLSPEIIALIIILQKTQF